MKNVRSIFLDASNLTGQNGRAAKEGRIVVPQDWIKFLAGLTCAGIFFLAPLAFSQTVTTGAERASVLQQDTQPMYGYPQDGFVNGQAVQSPNDSDIGQQVILKREEQYLPFTFAIATPVFYTSNVALTPNNEKGDVVFAPMAGLFYDPKIARNLYVHLGAREQIFYYGKYDSFNFGSLDCEAGLTYFVPQWHNLMLRAWYDFNRLTFDDRLGDEFFSNHQIFLNAELPFRIGRAQQIAVGVDTNLSVGADHQFPRRNDYEGYLGYSADLTNSLSFHAAGRIVARDYHQNGRTDVSEIISASATYRLNNWISLSAMTSFAHSDSNQDVFDYDVVNVGGVAELSVRF